MFEENFQDVILLPAQGDPNLAGFPLEKKCGGGHGPFLDLTSVLCYCLCYQRTHYESLAQIFQERPLLDEYERLLVIDVGAGPATVPLALADRQLEEYDQPLILRYVDIEHSEEMRSVAGAYLENDEMFDDVRRIPYANLAEVSLDHVLRLAEDADAILVAFSFVLKQNDVSLDFVRRAAELVAQIDRSTHLPVYVLIQDPSGGRFNRHEVFHATLAAAGRRVEGGMGRLSQPHRQTLRDGTVPEQASPQKPNVVYYFGQVIRLA